MTDSELRDASLAKLDEELAHLKRTTRGLKNFAPPPTSEWGQALKARDDAVALIKQIGVTPPPVTPPPVTPPAGGIPLDQKTDFVPGIFNGDYMKEISTPYGPGFDVPCPPEAVTPWDASCKAVLGKLQLNNFYGKTDEWTMYFMWPSVGNPNGFIRNWLSCTFLEFHTESESGHHMGVDAGWFAGTGHNRLRFGRLISSPGNYEYTYSSEDLRFDQWYKSVTKIKWSSVPGKADGLVRQDVGRVDAAMEKIVDFSGVTIPATGNNSAALQLGIYSVTNPAVMTQMKFGGIVGVRT